MANTTSAQKQIRAQAKKTKKNIAHKVAFRDARKQVKKALSSKDVDTAASNLQTFYKEVDKAAKVGAIHPKTASRYKSRLAKHIAASVK